ncbi:MAG: response regulator [Desulfobacteraceae bacterium]|nr:response regulator [Desulfobacteraceae bacterium]
MKKSVSDATAKTLLIVDDEEGIRKVLDISLSDLGYNVLTAEDGKSGLDLFRLKNPHIVITDIKMPVMDGVALLKQIKQDNPDTEVIVLTGHGDMDLAIACLKLEATDFVTKPIDDDVLAIALKRANERIQMREQLNAYTKNLERLVEEKSARLIEAERRAAVGQAIDGLAVAMRNLAGDVDQGMGYFNELPCFVSIHSPRLKVVAANQRYINRLGDQTGKSSCSIYGALKEALIPCPAKATFDSGKGQRLNTTVTLLDGATSPVIVHTAPIRNAGGDVELVVEIAADIDEIRRLQTELRTTRQLYEDLFDAAPCYITVQDEKMRITAANRRFREDFANPESARCYEIYQQRGNACPDCPVRKTFKDGLPHQSEKDVTAPNGAKYRMLIWTSPIRDESGKITHVMELSTDVTRMRQLQDQLSSLGLMIGSVSHGIKGLLTGLDGGIYILDSGFETKNLDQIKEGWDIVQLMIERIRSMVLDILYYAKEKNLKWERVDVIELAEEIVNLTRPKAMNKAIELRCDFDPKLQKIKVDAGILHSVLTNLLENALDACATSRDRDKSHFIEFKVYSDNSDIVFEVRDNGLGMNPETLSKIFTPYFITRKKSGSGLGLYISNQILRKNNGSITADSQPGKGTRMTLRIPKKTPKSKADRL